MAFATAAIIGTLGALASVAAGTAGVVSAVKSNKESKQSNSPVSSPATDLTNAQKAAEDTALAAQTKRKAAIARSRTVYTSPLGIQTEASTAKKTLLGM